MDTQFSLWYYLKKEWKIYLPLALLCYFAALFAAEGFGFKLLPVFDWPYISFKDGLSLLSNLKRMDEGSFFLNARVGWPEGTQVYDFPQTEAVNYFLMKILLMLTGGIYSAFNLFVLGTFFVNFIASYAVCRAFGLNPALSFLCAFAYDFVPFHFLRFEHAIYTNYALIPVFVYVGYQLFNGNVISGVKAKIAYGLLMILCAGFVVYYSFFGCVIFLISGACGFFKTRDFKVVKTTLFLIGMIFAGFILNLLPNIIYVIEHHANSLAAGRSPVFTEIFGLKLIEMYLPSLIHRAPALQNMANMYYATQKMLLETHASPLGLLGVCGSLVTFVYVLYMSSSRKTDSRLVYLSVLSLFLIIYANVGGFSAVFSYMISPAIRSVNRISVVLAFLALLTLFVFIQNLSAKIKMPCFCHWLLYAVLFGIILWDQFPAKHLFDKPQNWENDKAYFAKIEEIMGDEKGLYQLPFIPYPEGGALNDLADYTMFDAFIHTKNLKMSYGGMKGRNGSVKLWVLSTLPISDQIQKAKELGYGGVMVYTKGYEDNGKEIIGRLREIFGKEPIGDENETHAFFKID